MDRVAKDDVTIWEKLNMLEQDMNATTITSDESVRSLQRQLEMLETVIREEITGLSEIRSASKIQMQSSVTTDLPLVETSVMQDLEVRRSTKKHDIISQPFSVRSNLGRFGEILIT